MKVVVEQRCDKAVWVVHVSGGKGVWDRNRLKTQSGSEIGVLE